jgi:hypothetical protein
MTAINILVIIAALSATGIGAWIGIFASKRDSILWLLIGVVLMMTGWFAIVIQDELLGLR